MKKLISSVLVLILMISIISTAFVFSASAAGATIAFNKSSYSVGNTISVTIRITGTNMTGADLYVNYNQANLRYQSGATSGGAGQLHIVTELDKLKSKAFTITFKALKNSTSAIIVSGNVSDGPAGSLPSDVPVSASANIKIKDAAKSTNANLKSLSLEHGVLSPKFSPSVTSYTAKVENSVTSSTVFATTADSKATTEFTGSSSLKVGENVRKVIVTAQSGATKTYTITITRLDEDEKLTNEEKEEGTTNPLETVIGGVKHVISTDISSVKLFAGFAQKEIDFKGEKITVATDKDQKFVLYYLSTTTSDTLKPFTYNSSDDTFTPVEFLKQGTNSYIFIEIPEEFTKYFENNSFKKAEITLNGFTLNAYTSSVEKLVDFYYLYAYSNGNYSIYRYDNIEKVLQRCPDFNSKAAVPTDNDNDANTNENGFLAKFNTLGDNAKIIVIALAGALVCMIILIVLLIIKLCTKIKYKEDLQEDFVIPPYNNVKFNKNFTSKLPDQNNKTE